MERYKTFLIKEIFWLKPVLTLYQTLEGTHFEKSYSSVLPPFNHQSLTQVEQISEICILFSPHLKRISFWVLIELRNWE